ncbi:hypothetical protein [Methanolacinia petrolearia]|uniref:hypothetical protein n=1 Tax=Methanolacinia petrolearia TaxID=54120 RepID=UPI00064E8348|nr:hypothetical protein [Methanolacinia petrolearia]
MPERTTTRFEESPPYGSPIVSLYNIISKKKVALNMSNPYIRFISSGFYFTALEHPEKIYEYKTRFFLTAGVGSDI